MKIQKKNTELIIGMVGVLTLMGSITSPAFAASSTNSGNYSPNFANPAFNSHGQLCSPSDGVCAAVQSSGVDEMYSSDNNPFVSVTAYANNNYDGGSPGTYGTSPSLPSSGPNIYYKAKSTFSYDITNPSGSNFNAYYDIHPILADSSGPLASCDVQYDAAGIQSTIAVTIPCPSYSSSSSDTYHEGVETYAYTIGTGSGATIVNMWANNGYGEDITSLTVCDTTPC